MTRELEALFGPRSIAVVGASDDPSKYGNWIAVRALRGKRPVYLINKGRPTVLGQPAFPSLRDLGQPVDLAVIAVPESGFEAAVDDALAIGVQAIVAISAGLGETGDRGRERQEQIVARVRAAGACLLGPNCLGILDHAGGLELTSFDPPPGSIALISQSGNIAIELSGLLADSGLGLSRFASLGNQADLEAADLLDACAADPGTAAIALYCEDFRDGRRFAQAAWRAYHAGKPVVLLAVGRGTASARGAQSHTGSLVTSGVVVDAVCDATGIELVATPTQMSHLLQALLRTRPPSGRRVAVFADGGGQAQVASDCLETTGLLVPQFSAALTGSVGAALPTTAATQNPVDVAGGGEQDISCFSRVTNVLVASDEIDAVLMTGFFGGYGELSSGGLAEGEIAVAHEITRAVRDHQATLIAHTMNWRTAAADVLRDGGVPVYRSIEDAVWTLRRISSRAEQDPKGVPDLPAAVHPLSQSGYSASRKALIEAGLPFVAATEVRDLTELRTAAITLRSPFVLKALGDEHKSDRGGVILGIADQSALEASWLELQHRLAPPSCSVEEMADLAATVELIVGVRRDARFGPVLLAGLGGIYTEVLRDTRCALAPVDHHVARGLLTSMRGSAMLTGARGRPPVDLDAAADVLVRLSHFAAAHPEIDEIECNPVAVGPDGAVCLDARIVLAQ